MVCNTLMNSHVVVATRKPIMKCELRLGKQVDLYLVILVRIFLQHTPSFHAHATVAVPRTRCNSNCRTAD